MAGKDEEFTSVPVSFDGTWAKRGFTSNHGVGFVISADTGKVLDYAVVSSKDVFLAIPRIQMNLLTL